MQKTNEAHAKMMLLLAVSIFGTIGIFRKFISLPSGMLALARGVIGMGFLFMLLLKKREAIQWAHIKRNLLPLCFSGVCLGVNWILLFEAYLYTSVPTATLCYYMAPVFVLLAAPFLLKEKLTVKKGLCAAAAFAGMILVSGVLEAENQSEWQFRGVLLGLAAALFYAGVIFGNKKIREISAYDKTIVQLGVSSLVLLPYVLLSGEIKNLTVDLRAVLLVICVGVLHTGIAYALYFGAIPRLKGETIALYSYLDPILALVLSALLLPGEKLGWMGVAGAVMILGATMICELPDRKRKMKP